jgi:hypothetical protein
LNLYGFVGNDPVRRFDSKGLSFGDVMIPVPEPSEGIIDCVQRIADELNAEPNPMGEGDWSGRWLHCVASCRISRECPGGRFTAWLAGDWWQDPWWQPEPGSEAGDRAANNVGRDACKKKDSCEGRSTADWQRNPYHRFKCRPTLFWMFTGKMPPNIQSFACVKQEEQLYGHRFWFLSSRVRMNLVVA